jgi:hypothetical protein
MGDEIMIILGSKTDIDWLQSQCNGRCVDGEWCIFADGKNTDGCPIEEGNCIVVKKNRLDMLEVVE